MSNTQGPAPYRPSGYGPQGQQPGYVQPQFGRSATDWAAPGSYDGPRPWEVGPAGVPMVPLQQAPPPRSKWQPALLPLDGQDYAGAYRPLQRRWGRFFAALAILAGAFMFGQMPSLIWMFFSGDELFGTGMNDPMEMMSGIMGPPWFVLVVNLSWAIMIPGSVIAAAVYGPRAWRFVLSVAGRWRWDVAIKSFALIAPFFALYIGPMLVMTPEMEWRWGPNWLLVVIVLLTTPLQSAGEEFFFRGTLTQHIAGWIPRPLVGTVVAGVVTGTIFGAMHMQGFTLPTLQLMFVGFVCSLLTWRTGGLEAASVLHACNNVFIMLPLAFLGYGAFDPNAPGNDVAPGDDPLGDLTTFGVATLAMALSYVAVHFGLRKEQRLTTGAPGAEALLQPQQAVAPAWQPSYAPQAGIPPAYGPPPLGPQAYGTQPGYSQPVGHPRPDGQGQTAYGQPPQWQRPPEPPPPPPGAPQFGERPPTVPPPPSAAAPDAAEGSQARWRPPQPPQQ